MKRYFLTAIACCMLVSCGAGPQRSKDRRDSLAAPESPATKRLPADSPASTPMPVIRTDTAKQADMPIAVPPKNIQPK